MGVPVQVMLDVPSDIAAELASGALVRIGGVVHSAATGKIIKHPGKGRLPAKEKAANSIASVTQRVWSSTGGKTTVAIPALGLLVVDGMVAAERWNNRRRTKALSTALRAYLDLAEAGEMTVGQIDALSSAIGSARGAYSNDFALIAEKIMNLVEGYTVALAQANETSWESERGADMVPLVHLERSLVEQRHIFRITVQDVKVGPAADLSVKAFLRACWTRSVSIPRQGRVAVGQRVGSCSLEAAGGLGWDRVDMVQEAVELGLDGCCVGLVVD